MKKVFFIAFISFCILSVAQTAGRKTRSDKGKKHNHTASYYAKKASKSGTSTKSSKKK